MPRGGRRGPRKTADPIRYEWHALFEWTGGLPHATPDGLGTNVQDTFTCRVHSMDDAQPETADDLILRCQALQDEAYSVVDPLRLATLDGEIEGLRRKLKVLLHDLNS